MTSTLTQQIDMLKTAKNTYKLPVKYVELGNELYLSGKSISIATNAAIPSGTRYEQVTGQPVDRISKASQLTVKHGVTGRSVTLAPYSITVIG